MLQDPELRAPSRDPDGRLGPGHPGAAGAQGAPGPHGEDPPQGVSAGPTEPQVQGEAAPTSAHARRLPAPGRPTPLPRTRLEPAEPLPHDGGGLGACAVRGKVTRGHAPPAPALCPAGGRGSGRGGGGGIVPAIIGQGCGRGHHPPPHLPRPVPRVRGAGAARAHPPARGIWAADRRRRRRPCPARGSVCKVSQRAKGGAHPPASGRGGGGAGLRTGRRSGTRGTRRGRVQPARRLSSRSPGTQVRPRRFRQRPGAALARRPLTALPRPARSSGRERHEIPIPARWLGCRGPSGGWRRSPEKGRAVWES